MPIRITVDGRSMLTEDFTLDECAVIESEVGESWGFVLEGPMKSAVHCKAVLARFIAREYGEDEARKRVGAMTLKQAADTFEVVADDRPKTYEDGVPVVDPKAVKVEPATTS